jgi:hypothetical protein
VMTVESVSAKIAELASATIAVRESATTAAIALEATDRANTIVGTVGGQEVIASTNLIDTSPEAEVGTTKLQRRSQETRVGVVRGIVEERIATGDALGLDREVAAAIDADE